MSGDEFVLSIVAIVMGSALLIVAIGSITSVIKTWINRNKSGFTDDDFSRLAKAFMQHKKMMEQRVENIESMLKGSEQPQSLPEIEIEESSDEERALNNDLENKRRIQS